LKFKHICLQSFAVILWFAGCIGERHCTFWSGTDNGRNCFGKRRIDDAFSCHMFRWRAKSV